MQAFDAIEVGQAMEALDVPITAALITGGAIATRDYFPGHIDLEAARALGSQGVFMNILTTNGLVQRFVQGWSGPHSRLCDLKIKLGAPNYPGDTMRFSGSVTDKRAQDRTVELSFKGANAMGSHVTGTVRVRFP